MCPLTHLGAHGPSTVSTELQSLALIKSVHYTNPNCGMVFKTTGPNSSKTTKATSASATRSRAGEVYPCKSRRDQGEQDGDVKYHCPHQSHSVAKRNTGISTMAARLVGSYTHSLTVYTVLRLQWTESRTHSHLGGHPSSKVLQIFSLLSLNAIHSPWGGEYSVKDIFSMY